VRDRAQPNTNRANMMTKAIAASADNAKNGLVNILPPIGSWALMTFPF
jgi:hypothetical protein